MKRIMSFILVCAMLIGMSVTTAYAEENGKVVLSGEEYASLDEAIVAAMEDATSEEITYEIYGKQTLNKVGYFSVANSAAKKINFVGKDDTAEIFLNDGERSATSNAMTENNYNGTAGITGKGASLTFTNLTISHNKDPKNSYIYDYARRTQYWYVVTSGSVTYTDCTFTAPVLAASTIDTFEGCTFINTTSGIYGLWGSHSSATNPQLIVKECLFEGTRAIKLYQEGGASSVASVVTVEDCIFRGIEEKAGIEASAYKSLVVKNNEFFKCEEGWVNDDLNSGNYTEAKLTELGNVACRHGETQVVGVAEASCTKEGYTGDKVCALCDGTLEEGTVIPATGHTYVDAVCACGHSIKVETKAVDAKAEEVVVKEEVKEVTVVEDENTVKAEASVSTEATEIVTAVVTEDEEAVEELVKEEVITKETAENIQKTVEAGDKVVSEIVVEEVKAEEVAKEVQTAIAKEAVEEIHKEAKVAQFLDISVFLKSEKTNETLGTINKLATPITITVAIPDDLQETGRVFYVLRNHDGVVEVLKTTNNGNGTISFTTDQFSTYALAYTDVKAAPATGDGSAVMAYTVMAIAALAVVVVLKKRNSFAR